MCGDDFDEEPDDGPEFLVVCPKCLDKFPLALGDISIRSCQSDGIYGAEMICPTCKYAKDIYEY